MQNKGKAKGEGTERDCGVCGIPATVPGSVMVDVVEGYAVPRCRAHVGSPPYQAESRLALLAEWLLSMDDPEDVLGRAERQQITLTKIIDRARASLNHPQPEPSGEGPKPKQVP